MIATVRREAILVAKKQPAPGYSWVAAGSRAWGPGAPLAAHGYWFRKRDSMRVDNRGMRVDMNGYLVFQHHEALVPPHAGPYYLINLADMECVDCGALAGHAAACPRLERRTR